MRMCGDYCSNFELFLSSPAAARDVLRDAVDLKARVKAEFELLQQLRAEIEDSESAFDWKVRFERLEKENLHLREKVEDFKDQGELLGVCTRVSYYCKTWMSSNVEVLSLRGRFMYAYFNLRPSK